MTMMKQIDLLLLSYYTILNLFVRIMKSGIDIRAFLMHLIPICSFNQPIAGAIKALSIK